MSVITPLRDKIIVKEREPVKETPGGIVLPDQHVRKTGIAVVLAVGPGRRLKTAIGTHPLLERGIKL